MTDSCNAVSPPETVPCSDSLVDEEQSPKSTTAVESNKQGNDFASSAVDDDEGQHLHELTLESARPPSKKPTAKQVKEGPASQVASAASAAQSVVIPLVVDEIPEAPAPSIEVNRHALKVLKVLFHDPDSDGTPGDISWKSVVAALDSAGLRGQKLKGSAWVFLPKAESRIEHKLNRSVHYHEPHPSSRIRFFIARDLGRRLTIAYNWTGQTFYSR